MKHLMCLLNGFGQGEEAIVYKQNQTKQSKLI